MLFQVNEAFTNLCNFFSMKLKMNHILNKNELNIFNEWLGVVERCHALLSI